MKFAIKLGRLDSLESISYIDPVEVRLTEGEEILIPIGTCHITRSPDGKHIGYFTLNRIINLDLYFYYHHNIFDGTFELISLTASQKPDEPTARLRDNLVGE